MPVREHDGFVRVTGFRLYLRTIEPDSYSSTILALHGGPGAHHEYLLPLADLAERGYRVVFLDQLGCGRSDRSSDPSVYNVEHNIEEVEAVRNELGLGRIHLVGSSYGGLLALAYAIQHQDHLKTLTTIGGLADVPYAVAEMRRLIEALPKESHAAIKKYGDLGYFSDPRYLKAVDEFYHRHLCRLPTWPPEVSRVLTETNFDVYGRMNGPNEFTITGTIKDINLTPRLSTIRVPTLVTGGRYDEVTPNVARQIRDHIPGARQVTFEQSSHVPFWEERPAFMDEVAGFLRSHD
ncbi:MAG TPA: proline iminopeptidase-family hydrolase [Thermoplasmata archaeon]|nr:proline iminopeptidase-family hydrolase [Thermoplasmata archaeon]